MGEMYADFLTKPLQGATFKRFWAMIKGIPKITPDVKTSCPRAMGKVTSYECVGQNNRQTQGTVTASTDDCGGMCMDDIGSLYTDTQTGLSTRKNYRRSTCTEDCVSAYTDATCTEDCVSACTDVSNDSMGVQKGT